VVQQVDPGDKRARTVPFTEAGCHWLDGFGKAVRKAERELRLAVGPDASAVLFQGLARHAGTVESVRAGRR
jgi:hypothetical protein